MRALAASVVLLLLGVAVGGTARADPQVSASATSGIALTSLRAHNGPRVAYTLGGRIELLVGRSSAGAGVALGPYLEILTTAFDTMDVGGGLAVLFPTGATGFVFSFGGFARNSGFGLEPGSAGTVFWGSRSFNYHSAYALSAGLFAQGRYGLGSSEGSKQADFLFGAQIDLEYLALPFLFAWEAIAR